MVWDAHAKTLAIKTIATVETNLNYTTIYYVDAITIGLMQNYGPKAAALLTRFRTENPASWVGVAPSLIASLDAYPGSFDGNTNYRYWSTRYLTQAEGASIGPILAANKAIQNDDAEKIVEWYADLAQDMGINLDTNTQTAIFFMVMLHQSPARARNVIRSAGANSTIDRVYSICMNEPVLSRYPSRYSRARDIIKSNDASGLEWEPGEYTPPGQPGGDSGGNITPESALMSYAQIVGNNVRIQMRDGSSLWFYNTGGKFLLPNKGFDEGTPIPDGDDDFEPTPSQPGTGAKGQQIVDWMLSKQGVYNYSQGSQRMQPDQSGYSDCSALIWYAYRQVLGITLGTWSGAQMNNGTNIWDGSGSAYGTTGRHLQMPGDIIWNQGHVEIAVSTSQTIGHGGPNWSNKGPTLKPYTYRTQYPRIRIQRIVND